ncbi:MAG: maleylpyruvate isomerase family mycothiol-dependent enzyme, partial [Actinobacteria bacterium]|nr:maleylpyruvate isomerase family mycothiol-dependent enzyme [Actinomycetota bacterium]
GAVTGQRVQQYPGGARGRAREIEDGAHRPAAELLADLRAAAAALEHDWHALPERGWGLMTTTLVARRPVSQGVLARWREVEVHHVDLAVGYGPADWPAGFVAVFLPRTIRSLPGRAQDVPDGYRWCLHDETSGTSWRVTAAAVTAGHGPADAPDAEISAAGWQLLAWLLGRGNGGIRTKHTDDTGTALRLPEFFPFA